MHSSPPSRGVALHIQEGFLSFCMTLGCTRCTRQSFAFPAERDRAPQQLHQKHLQPLLGRTRICRSPSLSAKTRWRQVLLERGERPKAKWQYEKILGKALLGHGRAEHWAHSEYAWIAFEDGDVLVRVLFTSFKLLDESWTEFGGVCQALQFAASAALGRLRDVLVCAACLSCGSETRHWHARVRAEAAAAMRCRPCDQGHQLRRVASAAGGHTWLHCRRAAGKGPPAADASKTPAEHYLGKCLFLLIFLLISAHFLSTNAQTAKHHLQLALEAAEGEGSAVTEWEIAEHHYKLGRVLWAISGNDRQEVRQN